jgi:predicted phosphoadenosine phosphosulfate sulfurtransferase
VRPLPPQSISAYDYFPFYTYAMTFEEFVPAFGHWYAQDQLTECFVGIRSGESLNRWRTIAGHGTKFEGRNWTNYLSQTLWNIYPIYDWRPEDIWTYHGKTGKPHNPLYDRMHQAGLTLSQMRICEPYGDEQRKGLWLYQVIEPETWGRVVARVAGANTGALYANEIGNVMGNQRIVKPERLTWRQFAETLLDSMPPQTADHYRDKIAVWAHWWMVNRGYEFESIPDALPGDTGTLDKPSWRRICKLLLKNDYWCSLLSFSPTKTESYERYRKLMQKRRQQWGIFQ